MKAKLSLPRRLSLFAASVLVAGTALVLPKLYVHADDRTVGDPTTTVIDYADRMSRLVAGRKIEDLAKLAVPTDNAQTAKLSAWKSEYLSAMQQSEAQRDKQYAEAVQKARDYVGKGKLDEAMDKVVAAYQIAKDQDGFLKLDWVKELTNKTEAQAKDYESKGQWLESLALYSDLNSLYEISTRYKADMQRLARRTRLLAMYTPKTLFEMRKALLAKQEREKDKDKTGFGADEPTTEPSFPRWQDHVEGISLDMLKDALDQARNNWVEETSYEKLLTGGVEALRLFLSTPELSKEFPALADEAAKKQFSEALDGALGSIDPKREMRASDFDRLVASIVEANGQTIKLPREVAIMEFTDGAMEKLDPFTAVIWPHEVEEFEKNTRGSFGGVGIQISLENGLLKVISPLEDTPAFKAGIEAGDVVTAIDGKSTVGISIDQAVHSIMGKPGTDVTLKVKRENGEVKDFRLTRAEIKVSSVKGARRDKEDRTKWDFMLDRDNRIGYVRITGFQEDTSNELQAALESLQARKARGVILDLRFNPGGLLKAAVDISDKFIDNGVIVSTRGRTLAARDHTWRARKDVAVPTTLPVVVLVNQYSASASEIFAGAMKDLHRALIVGQRSFGKGSVQNLIPIGTRGSALMKLTMSYYYLPNNESLHRRDGDKTWGVDPDVTVELTPKQLGELIKQRRDSEIIHRNGNGTSSAPASAPATGAATGAATTGTAPASQKAEPVIDTQLDTALLMLRLQLVQERT